jgi:hypothetical protein
MVMLGDLLGAARDSAGAFEAWLTTTNPDLAAQVARAAAKEQVTFTSYVRQAVANFSRLANDEDWATLTSAMRDDADPGTTCLLGMVHWRLTIQCCDHHDARATNAA